MKRNIFTFCICIGMAVFSGCQERWTPNLEPIPGLKVEDVKGDGGSEASPGICPVCVLGAGSESASGYFVSSSNQFGVKVEVVDAGVEVPQIYADVYIQIGNSVSTGDVAGRKREVRLSSSGDKYGNVLTLAFNESDFNDKATPVKLTLIRPRGPGADGLGALRLVAFQQGAY